MTPNTLDPLTLIFQAGPLVKFVLLVLLAMSVTSWGVIVLKWMVFRSAIKQNQKFQSKFDEAETMEDIEKAANKCKESPVARLYLEGTNCLEAFTKRYPKGERSLGIDSLTRSNEKMIFRELNRLERAVPYLATVGSTAPFIGLFGTVWGIMNSFRSIGATGSANLAVVAPGIAEALIATAAGLAAAIPAVMAYNFFVHRVRKIHIDLDMFSADLINLAKQALSKG